MTGYSGLRCYVQARVPGCIRDRTVPLEGLPLMSEGGTEPLSRKDLGKHSGPSLRKALVSSRGSVSHRSDPPTPGDTGNPQLGQMSRHEGEKPASSVGGLAERVHWAIPCLLLRMFVCVSVCGCGCGCVCGRCGPCGLCFCPCACDSVCVCVCVCVCVSCTHQVQHQGVFLRAHAGAADHPLSLVAERRLVA